jgi:hypothetical protein
MRGAIPPLPQYSFRASCLVKHRDNFTFLSLPLLLFGPEASYAKVLPWISSVPPGRIHGK